MPTNFDEDVWIDGGHGALRLCPPYGTYNVKLRERGREEGGDDAADQEILH